MIHEFFVDLGSNQARRAGSRSLGVRSRVEMVTGISIEACVEEKVSASLNRNDVAGTRILLHVCPRHVLFVRARDDSIGNRFCGRRHLRPSDVGSAITGGHHYRRNYSSEQQWVLSHGALLWYTEEANISVH